MRTRPYYSGLPSLQASRNLDGCICDLRRTIGTDVFTFIHAADLHIDSPLSGLGLKDRSVAERFAEAGRRAVEALVRETIDSKAAFLLISGDVFDGDWRDVGGRTRRSLWQSRPDFQLLDPAIVGHLRRSADELR